MKILGVDPGYERCGFAVLEKKNSDIVLQNFGTIRTQARQKFEYRLEEIARDFETLLDQHTPHMVSIEDLFFVQNVTTGLKVSQVRGVLILAAHRAGCQILEPKPVEIKKTFCGHGKADKKEMQKMAQIIFGLQESPKMDDAADAIAAGYFAAQNIELLG